MTHYPDMPGGYVVYCDDIRDEVGGKITLVGIYSGEMNVGVTAPVAQAHAFVPLLCCLVHLNLDLDNLPNRVSVEIQKWAGGVKIQDLAGMALDNVRDLPRPEFDPTDGLDQRSIRLATTMRISPLIVDGEFIIRAIAMIDGEEYRLGALKVRPNLPAPVAV